MSVSAVPWHRIRGVRHGKLETVVVDSYTQYQAGPIVESPVSTFYKFVTNNCTVKSLIHLASQDTARI